MIKAIIFDIGGVLYKGKIEDFYQKLQTFLGLEDNSFASLYEKHKGGLLLGNESFFDLVDKLDSSIPKKVFKAKAEQVWVETFVVQKGIVGLIGKLKINFKVGCLSNATDFDVIMDKKTGTDKLFDPYINSCEFKSKKPNEKMFRIALAALNCKASECIYIDDRKKYLETPKKMGFNVLLFEDVKKLKNELASFGVRIG